MHRAAGLASPCDDELVRLCLKGAARDRGTDQRQAAALTQRDADVMRATMGTSAKDARDLALVLVGRDLLARASELVGVGVEHVTFTDDGALVALRRRKTHTATQTYYVGPEASQALREWLERSGIAEGAIFQSVTKAGKPTGIALTVRDVGRILKARAQGARLSHAEGISGHSLRVGMAVDLVAADLDLPSVMQAGGWSTPRMVARYTEKLTARRGAVARYHGAR
jgi:integrase